MPESSVPSRTLPTGQRKGYCSLTACLRSGLRNPVRIRSTVGRSLPMPSYRPFPETRKESCSCFGEITPYRSGRSSTRPGIWLSLPRIRAHFPLITVFSGAGRSAGRTNIWKRMEKLRLFGDKFGDLFKDFEPISPRTVALTFPMAAIPNRNCFPVFPVTYPDIFYFFLRSRIADKHPKEENTTCSESVTVKHRKPIPIGYSEFFRVRSSRS